MATESASDFTVMAYLVSCSPLVPEFTFAGAACDPLQLRCLVPKIFENNAAGVFWSIYCNTTAEIVLYDAPNFITLDNSTGLVSIDPTRRIRIFAFLMLVSVLLGVLNA